VGVVEDVVVGGGGGRGGASVGGGSGHESNKVKVGISVVSKVVDITGI